MMPAAPTATAMPIMLRAPETMPAWISFSPTPNASAMVPPSPRTEPTTRRAMMITISETME